MRIVQARIAFMNGVIQLGMDIAHGNWRAIWNRFVDAVHNAWNAVAGAVRGMLSSVVSTILGFGGAMASAGAQLGSAFWRGFTGAAPPPTPASLGFAPQGHSHGTLRTSAQLNAIVHPVNPLTDARYSLRNAMSGMKMPSGGGGGGGGRHRGGGGGGGNSQAERDAERAREDRLAAEKEFTDKQYEALNTQEDIDVRRARDEALELARRGVNLQKVGDLLAREVKTIRAAAEAKRQALRDEQALNRQSINDETAKTRNERVPAASPGGAAGVRERLERASGGAAESGGTPEGADGSDRQGCSGLPRRNSPRHSRRRLR